MGSSMIGPGAMLAQASALQSQQNEAIQQLSAKDDAKIQKGAQDFEAMLLNNWLQQAEKSFATVPGADDDGDKDPGGDQMMSLGVQTLANSLAASGGIGIARMIAHGMEAAAEKAHAKPAAAAIAKGEGTEGKK